MFNTFNTLFPGMFHRRLALLLAVVGASMIPVGIQLYRLTAIKGEALLKVAETKLTRRQWTPTSRGRILDRKGRVLTQDRPSYTLAIDYEVLNGDWAKKKGREAARRAHKHEWADLSQIRKDELTKLYQDALASHLLESWNHLSQVLGLPLSELNARRDTALDTVERAYTRLVNLRRQQELDAALARGNQPTRELMDEIEKRVNKPILEQTRPLSIVTRISDETGFALQLLSEDETELTPEGRGPDGSGAALWNPVRVPRIPGIRLLDSGDREYPYDQTMVDFDLSTLPTPVRKEGHLKVKVEGVAAHLLGRLRTRPFETDISLRAAKIKTDPQFAQRVLSPSGVDRGEYREVDTVGDVGIEGTYEPELRGLRGLKTRRLDSGEEATLAAQSGRDVQLSIDINLQARVQAAMSPEVGLAVAQYWHRKSDAPMNVTMPDGTPLNGAAVVLDVDTGEILAMVSTPSFSKAQLRDRPEEVFGDEVDLPYLDRSIAKSYAAGSIVKPLMLTMAAKRGVFMPGDAIECTGHLYEKQPNIARCWIYKQTEGQMTHQSQLGHWLAGQEAIEVSCNIFFFTLGQRLGVNGIMDAYREFGVTDKFNLGLGLEFPGSLGRKNDGSDLKLPDAIQMGIGQGPIAWTPMHAADSYATLARGGVRIKPSLVHSIGGVPQRKSTPVDLGLPSWAVQEALKGMERSVTGAHGTGNGLRNPTTNKLESFFNSPGISVWGKTGTAAAPDLKVKIEDIDGEDDVDGPTRTRVVRSGDHSWYVVLVGRTGDRMKYVIAVVMDYAGSGGKVSGPIANQIVHALVTEGYL